MSAKHSAVRGGVLAGVLAGVLTMTAACAPHVQTAMTPPTVFAGPVIVESSQGYGMGHFVVQDGAQLPFRHWSPQGRPKAVIIALHGFSDHSAAWRLAGPWWAERGIEVWAYDQRGFGGAPNKGEWADPALSRDDLRTVSALVRAQRPDAKIAIMGESMGGALGISAFASDNPPAADRLILLGPAVWGWSSQNVLNRAALWAGGHFLGSSRLEPPAFATQKNRASDNVVELLRNGRDPRFTVATRIDALHGLVGLMEEGAEGLGYVRVPTLLAYGANDRVVPRQAMQKALERAGPRDGLLTAYYPEGWHILNRDLAAEVLFADVEAWLDDRPLPSMPQTVLEGLQTRHD